MAKKGMKTLVNFAFWLSTVLVGLGVGFAAINNTLIVPFIPAGFMTFAGWILVISTVISVIGKLTGIKII